MKTAVINQKFPRRAFTLIEIMIVVAIIGLIAAMGVPAILQVLRKDGMRKAVSDVVDVCNDARARAIFRGRTIEVVFHPAEKQLEIADAPLEESPAPLAGAPNHSAPMPAPPSPSDATGLVALPDSVDIAMLDINMLDFGASDVARVRFFPNGTCDELTLVLHSGDEWQKITLEFSTAMRVGFTSDTMKTELKAGVRRGREPRAFSLLEVTIAIGIFFMAVFAILGLVSGSLQNARRLQRSVVEASPVAGYLLQTNKLIEGTYETDLGEFLGDAYQGYVVAYSVQEVDTNKFFQVDFEVRSPDPGQPVVSKMTATYFKPQSPAGSLDGATR